LKKTFRQNENSELPLRATIRSDRDTRDTAITTVRSRCSTSAWTRDELGNSAFLARKRASAFAPALFERVACHARARGHISTGFARCPETPGREGRKTRSRGEREGEKENMSRESPVCARRSVTRGTFCPNSARTGFHAARAPHALSRNRAYPAVTKRASLIFFLWFLGGRKGREKRRNGGILMRRESRRFFSPR